jgi:hypothetical protein
MFGVSTLHSSDNKGLGYLAVCYGPSHNKTIKTVPGSTCVSYRTAINTLGAYCIAKQEGICISPVQQAERQAEPQAAANKKPAELLRCELACKPVRN